jgi:hypothetical protein
MQYTCELGCLIVRLAIIPFYPSFGPKHFFHGFIWYYSRHAAFTASFYADERSENGKFKGSTVDGVSHTASKSKRTVCHCMPL